eukprot:5840725-Karenia_brevis.AAC.1
MASTDRPCITTGCTQRASLRVLVMGEAPCIYAFPGTSCTRSCLSWAQAPYLGETRACDAAAA